MPLSPVYPKKGTFFLLSLILGASVALGLTFCMEYLNNRIRSSDEIRDGLGLRVLGTVPRIPGQDTDGPSPLINDGVPPVFAESIRNLRSKVLFSAAGGTRAFLVTSSESGEGKTLVTSNFAVTLCPAATSRPTT